MTCTQLLEAFLTLTVQISVVVLVGGLLDRSLTRSAQKCAIWNTCYVCILGLIAVALLLPRLHLVRLWDMCDPTTLLQVAAVEKIICSTLLSIWATGTAVSLCIWLINWFRLYRILRACQELPAGELREQQKAVLHSGFDTPLRLLVSDDVDCPFCFQFHHPIIVLPRQMLDCSPDDLHNILKHECAHLRHNHPVQLFLQNLVGILCWFHPVISKSMGRAYLVREFACDDAVINSGVSCADYLRTLLHIAQRTQQTPTTSALRFGKTPTELVLRAKRLVALAKATDQPHKRRRFIASWAVHGAMITATCLLAVVTIPSDPLSSSRSAWSTWPTWTATSLHCLGVTVRDYEQFDRRVRTFEQLYDNGAADTVRLSNNK